MTKFTSTILLAALLGYSTLDGTDAFSSLPVRQCGLTASGSQYCSQEQQQQGPSSLSATESSNEDVGTAASAVMEEDDTKAPMEQKQNELLYIPKSLDEMVKQVSSAMDDAMKVNKQRQIVRILLPRSSDADNLLQYYEASDVDTINQAQDLVLCPTDESWQGGIMQLYRAASYASQEILRSYSQKGENGGVVPRLIEDRSIDESGVDGIGLWITQGATAADDVSFFVQPSQETVESIESISNQAGSRLVALINPQWREVDDALDSASRGETPLAKLASFLGGKGGSLKRLDTLGYETTFVLEGYVCRGGNVRLMKRFDTEWAVFAENDNGDNYIQVGTSPTRPSYQDVDKMLQDNNISFKYARDIGLAPKLE
mmetsp:Transcript_8960/g.22613  ORF Transcript_8960/g.22613 Transcript_8960/m.22613 type:complete len:373 (+) Transcript_8960:159-1277(+)